MAAERPGRTTRFTVEAWPTATQRQPDGSDGLVRQVWNRGAPSGDLGLREVRLKGGQEVLRVRKPGRVWGPPGASLVAVALSSREVAAHFRALAAAALSHSSTANVVGGAWAAVLGAVAFPAEEDPVQVEVAEEHPEAVASAVAVIQVAVATLADRSLTHGGEKNAPIYV